MALTGRRKKQFDSGLQSVKNASKSDRSMLCETAKENDSKLKEIVENYPIYKCVI